MFELLLLRHAKSSLADAGQADIDRPLNARGIAAAGAMGRAIAAQGLMPALVLCSPARRARETWDKVAGELPAQPPARIIDDLYDFGDGRSLLQVIGRHGEAAPRLLVVAHNPAIHGLALALVGHGNPKLRRRLGEKYPTCALANIAFPLERWSDARPGEGLLRTFLRPRDLAEGGTA